MTFKELELASNGVVVNLNNDVLEPRTVVSWGCDEVVADKISIVESIFSAYNNWELQRDRFLTGRAGTFFDFSELASVITDFVRAFDCTSYTSVYEKLCECIDCYTNSEDPNNPFYDILYNKEQEWATIDKQIEDPSIVFKIAAVSSLRSSNRFTVFHLSYIVYKLRKIVELEGQIVESVRKISTLCK